MLGKLLNHEFRATARVMWVIYAAMLVLSVASHFAIRYMDRPETNQILRILAVMVTFLWVLALIFGTVMTLVLMVQRFYKNYLTDEGYLMFTMPVSVHSMIFSKLIVAIVWIILTVLVMLLGIGVAVSDSASLKMVVQIAGQAVRFTTAHEKLYAAGMLAELAVIAIIGMACSMMQFYAAMSLGYGFTGHKGLWSVICYFAITVVFQIIGSIMLVGTPSGLWLNAVTLTPMQGYHLAMLVIGLIEVAAGAALYVVTWLNLKKRLNLA